jgi:hypothetical protein
MNDLIESLPSPSPTAGITHTWMGESWMVVWETSVMIMMKISSKSSSQQGARTEFLVPNRGFWWWWRSRTLSGKKHWTPDSFRSWGICRWKEGSRRRLGWPHHTLTRPGLGRATRGCGGLPALLRLVFWLRGSSSKIGILQYFLGFFLKVGFLHKNKTPGQFCWKQH